MFEIFGQVFHAFEIAAVAVFTRHQGGHRAFFRIGFAGFGVGMGESADCLAAIYVVKKNSRSAFFLRIGSLGGLFCNVLLFSHGDNLVTAQPEKTPLKGLFVPGALGG